MKRVALVLGMAVFSMAGCANFGGANATLNASSAIGKGGLQAPTVGVGAQANAPVGPRGSGTVGVNANNRGPATVNGTVTQSTGH